MPPRMPERAILPAKTYTPATDLWVVSTYFDSEGYASKLRALKAYLCVMERSGIPTLLVEGAFRKRPFLLPETERVIHVRCRSVLWQKERLLNVAIDRLPASCHKVAWLDADVFFENPEWAVRTSELLDRHPVVQPFDAALWLPKGETAFRGKGLAWPSFAAEAGRHPGLFLSGDFDRHGHSGYAWAAQRDLVARHGLYDRSIAGSGDHLMAHAMMGDFWSPCVTNSVGAASPFRASFEAWARPFHADVRSDVGFVPGALLHRWHGDRKKRRYYRRMVGLLARQYDPARDVRQAPSGALEWTDHGAALGRWMRDYFSGRQEDAKPGPVAAVPADALEALRHDWQTKLDLALTPLLPLLGPLATVVSENGEAWATEGLVPVLPYLVATLLVENTITPQPVSAPNGSSASLGPGPRSRCTSPSGLGAPPAVPGLAWGGPGTRTVGLVDLEGPSGGLPPFVEGSASPPSFLWAWAGQAGRIEAPMDAARQALRRVLLAARRAHDADPSRWEAASPAAHWSLLAGRDEAACHLLFDELRRRVRDPRTHDAPELRSARASMSRRRAKTGAWRDESRDPFDAVVGPGSSASGLDHV